MKHLSFVKAKHTMMNLCINLTKYKYLACYSYTCIYACVCVCPWIYYLERITSRSFKYLLLAVTSCQNYIGQVLVQTKRRHFFCFHFSTNRLRFVNYLCRNCSFFQVKYFLYLRWLDRKLTVIFA